MLTPLLSDGDLDIEFTSNSQCGRDFVKNVSSTIFLRCSPLIGYGIPEFLHETSDCQYLFVWYTSVVCPLMRYSETQDDPPLQAARVQSLLQHNGLEKLRKAVQKYNQEGRSEEKCWSPLRSEAPDVFDAESHDEGKNQKALSGRSQAVGAVLSLLLVVLTACLIILLLYKKDRRETVMQRISNCCRRGPVVSYKYSKVNTDEETDENETEWLMEETSTSSLRPGRNGQENGHIHSKSVRSSAFTSLSIDDQDSEDEVLTVPEVQIHSARRNEPEGANLSKDYISQSLSSGGDASTDALLNDRKGRNGKSKAAQRKEHSLLHTESFHDDSDEDMLKV